MAIEGFDHKEFAAMMGEQAKELVPPEFNDYQKEFVVKTLASFSLLAGESLSNDTTLNINAEQAVLITQLIAEWSYHKSIDLIRSGITPEYWEGVMQKVAYTIFEVAKHGVLKNIPQDQLLQLVEHHVVKAFQEALDALKEKNIIDEAMLERAKSLSNIDEMAAQMQEQAMAEAAAQEAQVQEAQPQQVPAGAQPVPQMNDNKVLKLASLALLFRTLSRDKVTTILTKFNPQDAQTVVEYMQMPDLEKRVDRNTALKYLNEMKDSLPKPKSNNPKIILGNLTKKLAAVEREDVEFMLKDERPLVKKFLAQAYEGEFYPISPHIAAVIARHIEDSV